MEFDNKSINYIEFSAVDLSKTKSFFSDVFAWTFEDYGDDYTAFVANGLMGGFFRADATSTQQTGGALLVFYSDDLAAIEQEIIQAGGTVTREIFEFPGGRRFHFTEPSGNEMAVWSEK
ncbi:glyoxalase [Vibrio sp. MACH09]|uniref:VOC family protein n=1 Tax=Vibrio sp. MACH09 TaxID=3025122 RepID=UPI0027922DA4|nr:VOC family protein [Vibrio sp. MACH09]GLO63758.1 glyoxalase [Vibrio sp. MACH09]